MQNYLASFGEFVLVIQGAIFVVIVMAFRKGLVGEVADWWKSRSAAKADPRMQPGPQPRNAARHAAGRVIAGRGVVPQARVIAGATSTTRKGRATPSCSVTVTYSPFTNRCRSKRKIGSSSSSPGS